jgi:hypothetical protein
MYTLKNNVMYRNKTKKKMKYFRLKTIEPLPNFINKEGNVEQGHVTFASFGETQADYLYLTQRLSLIKPFILRKLRSDMFGENKDIPVVVYEVLGIKQNTTIQRIRLEILKYFDLLHRNFEEWVPHISNVDFNKSPTIIQVMGIEADDESFSLLFN